MLFYIGTALFAGAVFALENCPTTESEYNGGAGLKYATCADTNLEGPTLQIVEGIADVQACVAICDNDIRCQRAVFDKQDGKCYIKDNKAALSWVANEQFDVVRLDQTPKPGFVISKCPYTTSTYTSPSGVQYQVCPGTELRGRSQQVIKNVANRATCQQRCGTTAGCRAAVYDTYAKQCDLKEFGEDATLVWATARQFDVIQTIRTYNPASQGQWSDLVRLPVIPVAVYVVPEYPSSNRILAFSSWGEDTFGGKSGYTQFTDYNWNTGAVSQRTVSNTQHDMFCPGLSALHDGRILITGGSNAEVSSFYNPSTNDFTRGPNMKIARGYQTSVTLSDGKVFTIGGCYSGGITGKGGVPFKNGEVYDPVADTWTLLKGADVRPMLTTDAEGPWRTDNHGWLFAWRNGSVFQAGPSPRQNWYTTTGQGGVSKAGVRPDADDQMCGVNVMYDIGKILSAGGSTDYSNSDAVSMTHITTIGTVGAPSQVERVADMNFARGFANGVVLPDGSVLVMGGQKRSMVFTDTDGALSPELFDPKTKTWIRMAREAVPRNYHSASVLLADARVWSGGGGLCYVGRPGASERGCNKQADHADGQIFSPPYLFTSSGAAATRPVISQISTTTPKIGSKLTVTMNSNNVATFALVRIGSSTHSINSDQRRVPVSATQANARFTLTLPNDSGVVIPGHYYLFALVNGVPSVARTVRVLP